MVSINIPPSTKIGNLAGMWWARLETNSTDRNHFQARPFSNLTSSAKKNLTTEPISIFVPG